MGENVINIKRTEKKDTRYVNASSGKELRKRNIKVKKMDMKGNPIVLIKEINEVVRELATLKH